MISFPEVFWLVGRGDLLAPDMDALTHRQERWVATMDKLTLPALRGALAVRGVALSKTECARWRAYAAIVAHLPVGARDADLIPRVRGQAWARESAIAFRERARESAERLSAMSQRARKRAHARLQRLHAIATATGWTCAALYDRIVRSHGACDRDLAMAEIAAGFLGVAVAIAIDDLRWRAILRRVAQVDARVGRMTCPAVGDWPRYAGRERWIHRLADGVIATGDFPIGAGL